MDVNECDTDDTLCPGFCENLLGNFRCNCPANYDLSDDGRNCIHDPFGKCFQSLDNRGQWSVLKKTQKTQQQKTLFTNHYLQIVISHSFPKLIISSTWLFSLKLCKTETFRFLSLNFNLQIPRRPFLLFFNKTVVS